MHITILKICWNSCVSNHLKIAKFTYLWFFLKEIYFLTRLSMTNQETIRVLNTFKAIQWMGGHGISTDGLPDRLYKFVHAGSTLPIEPLGNV